MHQQSVSKFSAQPEKVLHKIKQKHIYPLDSVK